MIRFVAMDVREKISIGSTMVALGHHNGIKEIDEGTLQPDELAIVSKLSPRKRSEWLASRELLYQIIDLPERVPCLYDDFGKPILKGIPKQISISHSELWCAAMVSDHVCGVDIQVYTDTVLRIADRFLTPTEVTSTQRANNSLQYTHVLWGAKECMYKAYGKKKLGFREHIFITSLHEEEGYGLGAIDYEGIHLTYDIYFRILPEVVWVFCIERDASNALVK